jgi:hypothetical protein
MAPETAGTLKLLTESAGVVGWLATAFPTAFMSENTLAQNVAVALCQRNAILVIFRCLRRSQRRSAEINAKSFAPYGYCAVFS